VINPENSIWNPVMTALAKASPEIAFSNYYQNLERSFSLPDALHPVDQSNASVPGWVIQRAKAWQMIGELIAQDTQYSEVEDSFFGGDKQVLINRLDRSERLLKSLKQFRQTYIRTFEPFQIRQLNPFIELSKGSVSYLRGFIDLLSAQGFSKSLKVIRTYRDAMSHLNNYIHTSLLLQCRALEAYFGDSRASEKSLESLKYVFIKVVEIAAQLGSQIPLNHRHQGSQYLQEIRVFSQSSVKLIDSILGVDCSSNYLAIEIGDHILATICADSAEGKAIQRIRSLPPEPADGSSNEVWDEWRTHARISAEVELGREVDKEALLERLRKGGVKI
jgi:hypothetical protein